MRIGIFGDAVNSGTVDQLVDDVRTAESQGFATFWSPQIFGLDALTALAVAGHEVPRIELGTAVVPTYPRHPMMLAQQALTVQQASGGRLCLGIGLSHQIVIEALMGMSFEKPVRHLREYLSVLGPLVRGEGASFQGEVYKVQIGLSVSGIPPVPVVVAALGEQMLRVAAKLADGTLTWCTGPATLASHIVPTIRAAADEFERPAPRVIAALPVCVTSDVAGAKERASGIFAMYGQLPSYRAMLDKEGAAGPADIVIAGSAAEVGERIAALGAIGVTDFAAVEFSTDPDEAAATRELLKSLL